LGLTFGRNAGTIFDLAFPVNSISALIYVIASRNYQETWLFLTLSLGQRQGKPGF
jgi:hypothetical protein